MGIGTPVYAHLPLLHGPDGKKLSKRHGAASVQELRDNGYLPEAVRNYLALLGWGFDDETTFFTTEALQRDFSLEGVSKSPAVFDEQKLRWMNGRYLRELGVDDLTARLEAVTGHTGLRDAVAVTQEKISTLDEFWPLARSFFEDPVDDPAARERFLVPEAGARGPPAPRARARRGARAVDARRASSPRCAARSRRSGMKAKQVFQPLRVALTGSTISPGIFETVALVGRDRALARIDAALDLRRDG